MDKSPICISNAEAKRIKDALRDKMVRLTAKQETSSSLACGEQIQLQNTSSSNRNQINKSIPLVGSNINYSPSTSANVNLPSTSSKSSESWKPSPILVEVISSDSDEFEERPSNINHNSKTVISSPSVPKNPRFTMEVSVDPKKTNYASSSTENLDWQNFVTHLLEIQQNVNLWYLFNQEDVTVFNEFIALSGGAQKVYVKLLDEKYSWHRESSLKYPEISPELRSFIDILVEKRFLTTDISKEEIIVLVELMTLSELKSLCKCFSLRVDGSKKTLAKSLMEFSNNQTIVCGEVAQDIKTVIREKVIASLGRIVKLSSIPRQLFLRTMLLYSLPLAGKMDMDGRIPLLNIMNLVSKKQIAYPDYVVDPLQNLFTSRESLVRFQDALVLEAIIKGKIASKSLDEVVNLYDMVLDQFVGILGSHTIREVEAKLPLYLRTLTSGTVLARALNRCMECLRSKRMYSKMVFGYETLLSQEIYLPNSRGMWYDQLAQIFHHHMKDFPKAVDFLTEALTDKSLTPIDRVMLSNRGLLIANRKKKNKAEAEKNAMLISMLSRLKDPPEFQIQARCISGRVAGESKISYIYETDEGIGQILSSLEETVMLHHKQLGFGHGFHAENKIGISIFGILFWDIIYKINIPNVFLCRYQKSPLDLMSGEFYGNRESLIKRRITEIKEKWSHEDMNSHIKRIWSQENGKESLVSWETFKDFNQFQILVEFIGRRVISKICQRIAKDFPIAREGFPGIIMWNLTTKKCKFIQVKRPGGELSLSQKSWLYVLNTVGADASACCVNAVGAKSLKRKSEVADNADPLEFDDHMYLS